MKAKDEKYSLEAIRISKENVEKGGGPFGAVVVKNGEMIGRGGNRVTETNDPTSHAEINAIREASGKLNSFDLSGCTIYCSCEPCPMCLSAIYWAKIGKIVYSNTREDAMKAGFRDTYIYDELCKPVTNRKIGSQQLLHSEAKEILLLWMEKEDKEPY